MKLLALLFLCSTLLLPSLTQEGDPQAIDCNDEDVFQAVDAALRKYNSELQSGNQFVLYRVLEGTKMVDSDIFYSFKYKIKEGNCSIQSGLTWQDCDYKDVEAAANGECTATVGKRGPKKFSVATQTCKITPDDETLNVKLNKLNDIVWHKNGTTNLFARLLLQEPKHQIEFVTGSMTGTMGPAVEINFTCLGCVHPISTNNPDLEPILKHAIEHFNNNTNHSHLFTLREVKRAYRQFNLPLCEMCTLPTCVGMVAAKNKAGESRYLKLQDSPEKVVAGVNFEVNYSIVQTNCSKEHFQLLNPSCKASPDGDVGECRDNAYVDTAQNIAAFSQSCDLYPGEDLMQPLPEICPGCPVVIPVDSPDLKEPLGHSIKKLNAEHNHPFYFKIDSVIKATSQVVAGMNYFIEFIARETNCTKESNTELTENCETKHFGQILKCKANVYMRPWENKVQPTVNCRASNMALLRIRPPGFSPFRVAQVQETNKEATVSPPYTAVVQEKQDPERELGPAHEHSWLHEKQIKHKIDRGHKHGHDQGHQPPKSQGLGHGHHKQHGVGHGHQLKLDYLKHQGEDGFGHGHTVGHGRKHGHGHGNGKHKNKDRNNGKHTDQRAEPLTSSSEDSTASPTQTQGRTEGTTPNPPLAQPSIMVIPSRSQDSDFIEGVMTTTSPHATEIRDDLIPDIHVQPDSLSFKPISDFPEATSHKCPGRPWKPVSAKDPTTETGEFF